MQGFIVLPRGTHHVVMREIPRLISAALHPDVLTSKKVVTGLMKQTIVPDAIPAPRCVSLSDADESLLAAIWHALPIYKDGLSEPEWLKYIDVFDASRFKPDWLLVPLWSDEAWNIKLKRSIAESEHKDELKKAISRGDITPRSAISFLPIESDSQNSIVLIDELVRHIASFNLGVFSEHLQSDALEKELQDSATLLNFLSADAGAPNFIFSESVRLAISTAEHWSERELEALCCGIPPENYCDRDDVAPKIDRVNARNRIQADIKSGDLYAELNPNSGLAERLYGGLWIIEVPHATRWAIFNFPKFPGWLASSNSKKIEMIQEAEKLAEGRYTLKGAAKLIAENTGEREDVIRKKLVGAAERYELSMYEPGKKAKIQYGPEQGCVSHMRIFYEECYWDDLNKWLEKNELRMTFRFPAPIPRPLWPPAEEIKLQPKVIALPIEVIDLDPIDLAQSSEEPGLSKRERQIRAIVATAKAKGYLVLEIKTGNKTLLRKACKKEFSDLFGAGDDPFDDAWDVAIKSDPPRLRMANHDKFARR